MKKMYKAMLLVLCAVLLVAGSVMGTLAYLKAQTGTVTNTMTVGKVEITLDEAKVNVYGEKLAKDDSVWETGKELADRVSDKNDYKLIPGHTYTKDPIVTVKANSEACYLFVKVVNGISAIEAGTTIAVQMAAKGWKPLDGVANVFYKSVAATDDTAVNYPVFDNFTIADNANENTTAWKAASIEITAYAIQADGFTDTDNSGTAADEAWDASGFGTTNSNP